MSLLRQGLEVLCETAEDCWDSDAEARVSACCVLERVSALRHQQAGRSPSVPTVTGLAEPLLPPPPGPRAGLAASAQQLSEPLLPPHTAPAASVGPL